MKILITGIHGFIGSNLVAALQENHTIYGLDIIFPEKAGVQKTYGWNELDQLPEVDAVIHLAGKAHDTRNTFAAKDYFDINVGLTQKIFQYFQHSGATKFIYFSSVKAVADQVKGAELTEDETPNPQTPYGKSKLEAEKYILAQVSEPATRNPQPAVYILRPCMIHGPGNKGNLNLLYQIQQKGLAWPLGAFENKRSFCSMDNLQYVIQEFITKDPETGIYQLADDEPLSTNELIRLIAYSRNKQPKIWQISAKSIRRIAKIGDYLHLPLNSERLKKLTESYVVSNSKLKNALGIEQMPVSARTGMRKTLDSFE